MALFIDEFHAYLTMNKKHWYSGTIFAWIKDLIGNIIGSVDITDHRLFIDLKI